jgi:hypothetical protein
MVSLLGLLGTSMVDPVVENVGSAAPGAVRDILVEAMQSIQSSQNTAGFSPSSHLAGGLWSAANYVGPFTRVSNSVYDVPEGRPIWKTLPTRLGGTLVTAVLLTLSVLIQILALLYWASPTRSKPAHGGRAPAPFSPSSSGSPFRRRQEPPPRMGIRKCTTCSNIADVGERRAVECSPASSTCNGSSHLTPRSPSQTRSRAQ